MSEWLWYFRGIKDKVLSERMKKRRWHAFAKGATKSLCGSDKQPPEGEGHKLPPHDEQCKICARKVKVMKRSDTQREFKIVEYSFCPKDEVRVSVVRHGDAVFGLNIVAVVEGQPCMDPCDWCHGMDIRVRSRVARRWPGGLG